MAREAAYVAGASSGAQWESQGRLPEYAFHQPRRQKILAQLSHNARRLDAWLHLHLGRPYNVMLSLGLVISIMGSVTALSHDLETGLKGNVLKSALGTISQMALLINQLAQWDERGERQRSGKNQD